MTLKVNVVERLVKFDKDDAGSYHDVSEDGEKRV